MFEDFRANAEEVTELRQVLANPTLQRALLIIHDGKSIVDADDNSGELASVRRLSNLAGRAEVIRELYELATPLVKPAPIPAPTFGVEGEPPKGWVGV